MTTYSTSAECAAAAGIHNLGTTSRPTTAEIDAFRADAFTLIVEVIGSGVSDNTAGTLKQIERNLVKQAILNYLVGDAEYEMELTDAHRTRLLNKFADLGSWSWTPGANA